MYVCVCLGGVECKCCVVLHLIALHHILPRISHPLHIISHTIHITTITTSLTHHTPLHSPPLTQALAGQKAGFLKEGEKAALDARKLDGKLKSKSQCLTELGYPGDSTPSR